MTTQLHLTGPLGEAVSLTVTDATDLHAKQRAWGKKGWTPGTGDVPAGGFTLPYCMADTFDWAMIGATAFEIEGQQVVKHRGHIYKRRDFEAQNSGKKMPASVKYSRGAKPTDPIHLKEGDEGGVQYVTLIVFRGGGNALTEYELPKQGQQQQQARPAQPVRPAQEQQAEVKSDISALRRKYFAIVGDTFWKGEEGRAELAATVAEHLKLENFTGSVGDLLKLDREDVTGCVMATAENWTREFPQGFQDGAA